MDHTTRLKSLRLAALIMVVLSAACDRTPTEVARAELTLDVSEVTLLVYDTVTLTAWLSTATGSTGPPAFEWLVSDTSVLWHYHGLIRALRPGVAHVVVRAGALTDTAIITVEQTVGAVRIDPQPLPRLAPGDTLRLNARVFDTEGHIFDYPALSWQTTDTTVATVDADGLLRARAEGAANVTVRAQRVDGWSGLLVRSDQCADRGDALDLEFGQTRTFHGPESVCVGGFGSRTYAFVLHNTAAAGNLSLEVHTLGGIAPRASFSSTARPGPLDRFAAGRTSTSSSRLAPDRAFESRLRHREHRELSGLLQRHSAARRPQHFRGFGATAPQPGSLLEINTSASCQQPDRRTGRVVAAARHAIIVVDTANPPGGLTAADYEQIGTEFDDLVYDVIVRAFGTPTDLDGNGRVIVFYTRAVNEMTPTGSDFYVGGYFWAGDLFPKSECASSNEAEIFYMLAADPQGEVNGNVRGLEFIRKQTVGVLAHEFQHLINASRRIYVTGAPSFEEIWLNEGLSHIAEELIFYRASGFAPAQKLSIYDLRSSTPALDAANRYALANLVRLGMYLEDPERQSGFQSDDDLPTRGAIWQFLRYAADRTGGDHNGFWRALVDATAVGRENLQQRLGGELDRWIHDAHVTQLVDRPGFPRPRPDPVHTYPSWEFHSILRELYSGQFPLKHHRPEHDRTLSLVLVPAGAAYVLVHLRPDQSAEIRVRSAGQAPPSSLWVTVSRF